MPKFILNGDSFTIEAYFTKFSCNIINKIKAARASLKTSNASQYVLWEKQAKARFSIESAVEIANFTNRSFDKDEESYSSITAGSSEIEKELIEKFIEISKNREHRVHNIFIGYKSNKFAQLMGLNQHCVLLKVLRDESDVLSGKFYDSKNYKFEDYIGHNILKTENVMVANQETALQMGRWECVYFSLFNAIESFIYRNKLNEYFKITNSNDYQEKFDNMLKLIEVLDHIKNCQERYDLTLNHLKLENTFNESKDFIEKIKEMLDGQDLPPEAIKIMISSKYSTSLNQFVKDKGDIKIEFDVISISEDFELDDLEALKNKGTEVE